MVMNCRKGITIIMSALLLGISCSSSKTTAQSTPGPKGLKDYYKNSVYGWDVVNEAIDDKDSVFYRQSAWYKICGEDFIAKAFEYAHAADPKAILFYNDYNTENAGKREKIYQMVKKLKEAGVP